jgi:hypothetical protein
MFNRSMLPSTLLRGLSLALLLMGLCGGRADAQISHAPRILTVTNPATGLTIRTTDGGMTWAPVSSDKLRMQVDAGSVDALRAMAWPNPTSGATTIQFRLDQPGALMVTLHDIQGKEVARFDRGASNSGRQAISFDAGGLPDGLYYYHVTSDGRHCGGGSLLVTH